MIKSWLEGALVKTIPKLSKKSPANGKVIYCLRNTSQTKVYKLCKWLPCVGREYWLNNGLFRHQTLSVEVSGGQYLTDNNKAHRNYTPFNWCLHFGKITYIKLKIICQNNNLNNYITKYNKSWYSPKKFLKISNIASLITRNSATSCVWQGQYFRRDGDYNALVWYFSGATTTQHKGSN